MKEIDENDFRQVRKVYNKLVAETMFEMMKKRNVSYSDLSSAIQDSYNVTLNPGNISKYNSGNLTVPLLVIDVACRLLDISIDELFACAWKRQISIEDKGEENVAESLDISENSSESLFISLPSNGTLISNPDNRAFRGYEGEYFVYFAPTASNEQGFLRGSMSIRFDTKDTRVKLVLKDHLFNGEEHSVDKTYEGTLVFSTTVRCCYCILSCPDVGEMCFLTFRHFSLNKRNLECRVAQALTVSAGNEDRYPTVHRVLISHEFINNEDIQQLLPLLELNCSEIFISEDELEKVTKKCAEYQEIIDQTLTTSKHKKSYYQIRESTIYEVVKNMKKLDKSLVYSLIVDLRECSVSSRYNKVSRKADRVVRNFLKLRGYFKNKNSE